MDKTIEIEDGAHSELGPSSAERWLECPGSVIATRGIPDKVSAYAISGTASHTLSEWCRLQGKNASEFLGTKIRVKHANGFTDCEVDKERAASVQEFVDKLRESDGDELVEARVSYTKFVPSGFGTLDAAKLKMYHARIVDFKDGSGVQKYAKMNPQLMLYAVGVWLAYDWLYEFKSFTLAICQPRLDHYDEWDISLDELLAWVEGYVVPRAQRALKPGAPFKAGSWCQFCRIKDTCRVRAESVFDTVTGEFEDLDTAVAKTESAVERMPTLSNDEIAKILLALPSITKWVQAVKSYAEKEVREGRAVGDFKFVAGRSSRDWAVDAAEVEKQLLEAGASKEDIYTKPELLGPAKVEKVPALGKKLFAPATEKKEAGKLANLIRKSEGKPTLVPGSDPRPAVSVDPTTDFEDVDSTEE